MEITERERLLLVEKKEEICSITTEIITLVEDEKNALEIKKKITSILSLINTIASYSNARNWNLDKFTEGANVLFHYLEKPVPDDLKNERDRKLFIHTYWQEAIVGCVGMFCNYANSIRFDFTKRDVKIRVPKMDISIFRLK